MIVVVMNYLNGWCQNDNGLHPLRGSVIDDTTIISIPIKYIKLANIKLIEHRYCNVIINEKDSIIDLERRKYYIADSLYREKINHVYDVAENLEQKLDKENKRKRIWAGTAIGAVAAFLVTIICK